MKREFTDEEWLQIINARAELAETRAERDEWKAKYEALEADKRITEAAFNMLEWSRDEALARVKELELDLELVRAERDYGDSL